MKFLKNKKIVLIMLIILILFLILSSIGINKILLENQDGDILQQDETEITDVKIGLENVQRLGNGFAKVVIKIESATGIESAILPKEDGTSITVNANNKLALAKDLTMQIEKKYPVTVNTKDGKTVEKIFKLGRTISEAVSIGDFVDYSVGNWTEEDIKKVGNYYFGPTLPTDYEKFGGFAVGTSKDTAIKPTTASHEANKYTGGWRVLSKNSDGTVSIVYAGTPEGYYTPRSVHNTSGLMGTVNILGKLRDFSMYEDCSTDSVDTNYAVQGSAHCMTKEEVYSISSSSTLRAIGVEYIYNWEYSVGSPFYLLQAVDWRGGIGSCAWDTGIRPVVKIKAEVEVTAQDGQTTHDTLETAWKLSL